MLRSPRTSAAFVIVACAFIAGSIPLAAQWLKHPTVGVPKKAAGKVNMTAPTPPTDDGGARAHT